MFSIGWLVLGLIPIAALFSALALAVAAFARSTKEGQYYLLPLLLFTMPLIALPMLPTARLDLGTSIIPVSGMMLWLRMLIEGQYADALRYSIPVLTMTAACCWLSIRWAVRQFEKESVLFRESERLDVGLWLRRLVREREDTPSVAEGFLAALILLVITFFSRLAISRQPVAELTWAYFVKTTLVIQIAMIATPVLIMTIILTKSPRRTLLLNMPRPLALAAAPLLAFCLHPLAMEVSQFIFETYPPGEKLLESMKPMSELITQTPLYYVLLLMALTPAICEELAFRGFVLSGLRGLGGKWTAILLSSVFFGVIHGMLQQSLAAALVGVVIGYVAVQTGSLLPGVLFHLTYNSLSMTMARITSETVESYPLLGWLFRPAVSETLGSGYAYHWQYLIAATLASAALLWWFRGLDGDRLSGDEEKNGAADYPIAGRELPTT